MIYFVVLSAILAVLGLAAISAAQDIGLLIFGYGLFAFGVLFALFLVKRHFDLAQGHARH
jgi:pilus assembly protein TadC